jgi:hypothetical protein
VRPRALRPFAFAFAFAFAFVALASCASTRWPDERGVPVPLSYAENATAGQAFLDALTAARAGTTLPTPTVMPSFEPQLRELAETLQRGECSAPAALAAVRRWGETASRRPFEAWLLDCGEGPPMNLPRGLTAPPAIAISYVASHFRPRTASAVQCAIVVVSARGSEHVAPVSVGAPPK